jgi:FixJ family two-component response regulator
MKQKPINVAIVDDDESFARALERLFRVSGFEVRTYRSAEAFLAPSDLPEPNCLVLDIQLGGMSGLDLQRRLSEIHSQVPIVFVTAHDSPGVRREAEAGGCSAYLLKPVPRESLLKAVNEAVYASNHKSRSPDIHNSA